MKKLNTILLIALFALFASTGFSQIASTAHDFSNGTTYTWNTTGEICIVCHTPHNASSTTGAPLWNHTETSATFTLYSSSTLNATPGQPSGTSKLCLSCHDGSVGLGAFGGASNTSYITGTALLGTTLANDHPISFTYNTALATADGGLFDPSTATTSLGGTIADDLLFSGSLECASCHDAHDDSNGAFLVMSNAASALCLTCHDK